MARARFRRRLGSGPEPRPVPGARPIPGAPPQRIPLVDRRLGVRADVHRRFPRTAHLQPPGAQSAGRPPRSVRSRPRQPMLRLRPPGRAGRRLAADGDPAPPDHRRPGPGPGPCRHLGPPPVIAALVRVPWDADAGGPACPSDRDGVGVLQAGHHRPDGRAPVPAGRRARRGRPHPVPAPPGVAAGPGAHHDHRQRRRTHEGPGAVAGGARQGTHRAPRRPGRHRLAETGEPGLRDHRAAGSRGCGDLRVRRQRRAHRRAVRRGVGGGRAVALRGLLPAGHRSHGLWGAAGRHHRRGPARSGGRRRCDRSPGAAR